LSETRAIQAEVPTNLVGNLSHSLCWKAFTQPLSEGYTIHNLAIWMALLVEIMAIFSWVFIEEAIEETKALVEEVFTDANASASLVDSTSSTSMSG
jgi:hypothetical protein